MQRTIFASSWRWLCAGKGEKGGRFSASAFFIWGLRFWGKENCGTCRTGPLPFGRPAPFIRVQRKALPVGRKRGFYTRMGPSGIEIRPLTEDYSFGRCFSLERKVAPDRALRTVRLQRPAPSGPSGIEIQPPTGAYGSFRTLLSAPKESRSREGPPDCPPSAASSFGPVRHRNPASYRGLRPLSDAGFLCTRTLLLFNPLQSLSQIQVRGLSKGVRLFPGTGGAILAVITGEAAI